MTPAVSLREATRYTNRVRCAACLILALLAGCSKPPPPPVASPAAPDYVVIVHKPETFRVDLARFIAKGQYRAATALVDVADIDRQLAHDGAGYAAVGRDMVVVPGTFDKVDYDKARDWFMPGTSDALVSDDAGAWNAAAEHFAEIYNLRRQSFGPKQAAAATRPASGPINPPGDGLVGQVFVWPNNFLSGRPWEGQSMGRAELREVLDRRLPPVDAANGELPVLEVVSQIAGRRVVWVPAADESTVYRVTYREMFGEASPPTVGQFLHGLTTTLSEFGGPRGISTVGRRPTTPGAPGDAEERDRPYLIYTAYLTREYLAIVALPTEGE